MSITVTKNGTNITSAVKFPNLTVTQNLTNEVDTASFMMEGVDYSLAKEDGGLLLQEDGYKILLADQPSFDDDIRILDGASVVFAGKISKVTRTVQAPRKLVFQISCVDHSSEMDRLLVARTYENETVEDIITDIVSSFAPNFTTTNVACTFVVGKIVFNHVTISQCLRKLAELVRYDWYIDEDKDVHFFTRETNLAPFALTDTAGKHGFRSLVRNADGSQTVNRVKVRGGEYDGASFTDVITVKGSSTTSFTLPYKMANLAIELDTGGGYVSKTVGIEFIDSFPDFDVLHEFQERTIRFASALADGNKIRFTGNPKTPVVGVVEDADSIAKYGVIEKFIYDGGIVSNSIARKRAAAELMAYAEIGVDATFETYTAGLRTGMLINVNTSGLEDQLIIKRATFSGYSPSTYKYSVTCISAHRYSLLDLLRKIITPDARSTDEQETSESLFSASDEINFADTAAKITPANSPPTILTALDLQWSGSGSTNFSFDCTDADVLIIVVPWAMNITGITYNGSALSTDGTVGGTRSSAIYRLNSPTTGTNNITVSGTVGA
ncbi:MAG: hypothetical protein E6Q97_32195, partial [Desulfurellales bacterium]